MICAARGSVSRDSHYLLAHVRSLCQSSPHGFRPWKAAELLQVIDRATRFPSDHGAFYLEFMEGMRDLVDSEEEDGILRRFATQTLAVEARVLADDRETRDHLTHVTQVFLCGWLILNGCRRFAFAPGEWRPYGWPSDCGERFKMLNRGWMFTSLLHDCAYSVEKARSAHRHEILVKGLFGATYRGGTTGGVDPAVLSKKALPLWRLRSRWIMPDEPSGTAPPAATLSFYQRPYSRGDHAIVGSTALYDAIRLLHDRTLAEVLEPSAVAIACHNNQYLVDANEEPSSSANRWFRLDLWEEPLAALLHLCDEIQEWSRERTDAISGYREGRRVCRYEATEVAHLEVSDSVGVAIEARLLRRLRPEDRPTLTRTVREQERLIAETGRRFCLLFTPRTAPPEFQIHLRLEQTVDDVRCGNALTVSWPDPALGLLQSLHGNWRQSAQSLQGLQRAVVAIEESVSPPLAGANVVLEGDRARMSVRRGSPTGVRAVVLAPGGAGKSTLFQSLARIDTMDGTPVQPLYVEHYADHRIMRSSR